MIEIYSWFNYDDNLTISPVISSTYSEARDVIIGDFAWGSAFEIDVFWNPEEEDQKHCLYTKLEDFFQWEYQNCGQMLKLLSAIK